MNNFVQPGDTLDLVAPTGGVTSGLGVLIGVCFAVAELTVAVGVTFSGRVEGVVDHVAEGAGSGQAWSPGDSIYWDNAAKRLTKTSTSNTLVAYAVLPKITTATTGRVKLCPKAV